MTTNLYFVLFGNGLEIRYQPNLKRDNIRKNILSIKKNNLGKNKDETAILLFPDNVKWFVKNNNFKEPLKDVISKMEITTWNKIRSVISNTTPDKSIEYFFMEIEKQIENKLEKLAIKEIFLKYLNQCSQEAVVDQEEIRACDAEGNYYNKITNEISTMAEPYEFVMTTNYTNFLERNGLNKDKIIYLHGEYENENNAPLLGLDKFNDPLKIAKQVTKNIENKIRKSNLNHHEGDISINLSIFGWSVNEEYDLISLTILKIFELIKGGLLFYAYEDPRLKKTGQDLAYAYDLNHYINALRKKFQDHTREINEINNWKINLNYYYFEDSKDKENFESYINKSKFLTLGQKNDDEILSKFKLSFNKHDGVVKNLLVMTPALEAFKLNGHADSEKEPMYIDTIIRCIPSEMFWWQNKINEKNKSTKKPL